MSESQTCTQCGYVRRPHEVLNDYFAIAYSRSSYYTYAGELCREENVEVTSRHIVNIRAAVTSLVELCICVRDVPPYQFNPCPHVELSEVLNCSVKDPRVGVIVSKIENRILEDIAVIKKDNNVREVYDVRVLYDDGMLLTGSQLSDRNKLCPACTRTADSEVLNSVISESSNRRCA